MFWIPSEIIRMKALKREQQSMKNSWLNSLLRRWRLFAQVHTVSGYHDLKACCTMKRLLKMSWIPSKTIRMKALKSEQRLLKNSRLMMAEQAEIIEKQPTYDSGDFCSAQVHMASGYRDCRARSTRKRLLKMSWIPSETI